METVDHLNLHSAWLSEALVGDLARLRFIIRFSNCPRIHNESVGEHSFYTALYSYMIGTGLKFCGWEIDMGRLLGKALMHDVDECFSGDFIRMFKHSSPALKSEIDKASSVFTQKLAKNLSSSKLLSDTFFNDWKKAKEEDEGRVVAFADYLSVLSYVMQEIELGNVRMRRQIVELKRFHNSFRKPEFDFIKHYIFQAGRILDTLTTEEPNERRKIQRNS